jgi:hypothetical protein
LNTVAFATGTEHTYPSSGGLTVSPPVKIIGLPARTTEFDGGPSPTYKADYRDHSDNTNTYGSWFSWCMVKQYEDILCPGTWRVPTEAVVFSGRKRWHWSNEVGVTSLVITIDGWLLGGNANSGSVNNVGTNGYYWSSAPIRSIRVIRVLFSALVVERLSVADFIPVIPRLTRDSL